MDALAQNNREKGIDPASDQVMTSAMVNYQKMRREETADDEDRPTYYGGNARLRLRQMQRRRGWR
jgi:hypothetical protein